MFRLNEVILGGWQEKTMDAMHRRRFDAMVARLPQLESQRLEMLGNGEFSRRIEACWQDIERKPMRMQQISAIRKSVLSSIEIHADCLSREEHALVERVLILGGRARIQDAQELEAAQALSLRLWGNVGIASGIPIVELDQEILKPAAKAIARSRHDEIRMRFEIFHERLSAQLYRYGMLDDRMPQRVIVSEVLKESAGDERMMAMARRYLWSSFDCIDHGGRVVLLHAALADPGDLLYAGKRMSETWLHEGLAISRDDILMEEIPLQDALERAIHGALRSGINEKGIARDLRYLCKQGAPLSALEEILQQKLIVLLTPAMRSALRHMFYMTPKWVECSRSNAFQ